MAIALASEYGNDAVRPRIHERRALLPRLLLLIDGALQRAAVLCVCGPRSTVLLSRKNWDLTHLAAKYPWLRVDSETIEEFRSPFQWVDAPAARAQQKPGKQRGHGRTQQCGSHGKEHDEDEDGGSSSNSDERFSLSGCHVVEPTTKCNASSSDRKCSSSRRYDAAHRPKKNKKKAQHRANASRAVGTSTGTKIPWTPRAPKAVLNAVERMPSILSSLHGNQAPVAHQDPALLFGTLRSDVDLLKQRAKARKKKARFEKKRRQERNILTLSFPVLSKAGPVATSEHADGVLAMRYTKQLRGLADAERKLKELVTSQIEAEKAKLPLPFLFGRNLDRTYCKEQSVRTTMSISTRLQHRMLCAAFDRWYAFLLGLQKEDRKQAAFQRSQVQALALFGKLAGDAYVGTLDRALHRWRQITREIVLEERRHAAIVIQVRFRQRRTKALLAELKRVALGKEFKRKAEIQQLLKFEAYGTAMRWSTLRNGLNLLLQNICARRIQFFFRRIMLRKRV